MTDEELAAHTVAAGGIEAAARKHWDAIAAGTDQGEYQAAMAVCRTAGSLRRALEEVIVARATKAQRAAVTR